MGGELGGWLREKLKLNVSIELVINCQDDILNKCKFNDQKFIKEIRPIKKEQVYWDAQILRLVRVIRIDGTYLLR